MIIRMIDRGMPVSAEISATFEYACLDAHRQLAFRLPVFHFRNGYAGFTLCVKCSVKDGWHSGRCAPGRICEYEIFKTRGRKFKRAELRFHNSFQIGCRCSKKPWCGQLNFLARCCCGNFFGKCCIDFQTVGFDGFDAECFCKNSIAYFHFCHPCTCRIGRNSLKSKIINTTNGEWTGSFGFLQAQRIRYCKPDRMPVINFSFRIPKNKIHMHCITGTPHIALGIKISAQSLLIAGSANIKFTQGQWQTIG